VRCSARRRQRQRQSTLLNIIGGPTALRRAHLVGGQDLLKPAGHGGHLPPPAGGLCLAAGHVNPVPYLNALENASLPCCWREVRRQAPPLYRAFEIAGLWTGWTTSWRSLGGEQQWVIAMAMATNLACCWRMSLLAKWIRLWRKSSTTCSAAPVRHGCHHCRRLPRPRHAQHVDRAVAVRDGKLASRSFVSVRVVTPRKWSCSIAGRSQIPKSTCCT
jgi:hypothetical protein